MILLNTTNIVSSTIILFPASILLFSLSKMPLFSKINNNVQTGIDRVLLAHLCIVFLFLFFHNGFVGNEMNFIQMSLHWSSIFLHLNICAASCSSWGGDHFLKKNQIEVQILAFSLLDDSRFALILQLIAPYDNYLLEISKKKHCI
jgi:hypothetical protein